MTRYILLIAALAFLFPHCQAQDMNETLKKTFIAFDTTKDLQKRVDLSNKFGLMSKKWNDKWAPHYYNAYSKAIISYMEPDAKKKDAYLDEAEKERDETLSLLGKDNDETYVLSALIANARLAVDGRSRWQKYGKIFDENLEKAKEVNPDNPRIYHLKGMSKMFTPKMFGGGKKAAQSYFEKAEPLFAKESDADMNKPFWGRRTNDYMLAQCKTEDKD
jgi:hypothetical protein